MGWSAAAAIVASLYSADRSADKQEDAAKRAEEEQRRLNEQMRKDVESRQKEPEDASQRTRRRTAGAMGRSDTILTSPFGLGSDTTGERRTLLGA